MRKKKSADKKSEELLQLQNSLRDRESILVHDKELLQQQQVQWQSTATNQEQELKVKENFLNAKEEKLNPREAQVEQKEKDINSRTQIFETERTKWAQEKQSWDEEFRRKDAAIKEAQDFLRQGAAEMDAQKQKLAVELTKVNEERTALNAAQAKFNTDRKELDQKLKELELQSEQHQKEVEAFTAMRDTWSEEGAERDQKMEEDKRNLELSKRQWEQQKVQWEQEKLNHLKAMEHSQEELQRNFSSLTTREGELKTLREQMQSEWTTLRKSELEVDGLKKTTAAEQQKEQAHLTEWESRLKQQEYALQEKQKVLDLREVQSQRQQSQWFAAAANQNGGHLMHGDKSVSEESRLKDLPEVILKGRAASASRG